MLRMPVHRTTKWAIGSALGLAVAAGGYAAGSPYWVARELGKAVEKGDVEGFRRLVDFEAVRADFKHQITAQVTEGVGHSSVAALGSMIAGALADRAVDALVTPEGLQRAILARRVLLGQGSAPSPAGGAFDGARLGYESWSRFVITLPTDFTDVKLMLDREGIGWKLVAVRLPFDDPKGR